MQNCINWNLALYEIEYYAFVCKEYTGKEKNLSEEYS